uniref:Uncharacterized protein n=2 Tax=Noccaea caerulescens TaxID=107243 RepID=A0A1J3FKR7_NOCCA
MREATRCLQDLKLLRNSMELASRSLPKREIKTLPSSGNAPIPEAANRRPETASRSSVKNHGDLTSPIIISYFQLNSSLGGRFWLGGIFMV